MHWTFSTPVASGIIPKSHLLWLQVNTSHLSTTCSRSLVVLDVELNLKWWHLVYISCPFLSGTPNKAGWRILGYTTYSTYITKIQTRLTCCCTLEKFSVFLCITGPYTLKSEIWQVVDIRGWGLSIALLPKKSNNTRLVEPKTLVGFNDFNVCFKQTIIFPSIFPSFSPPQRLQSPPGLKCVDFHTVESLINWGWHFWRDQEEVAEPALS